MEGRQIIMDVIVRPTLIPLDDREFGETADRGNFGLEHIPQFSHAPSWSSAASNDHAKTQLAEHWFLAQLVGGMCYTPPKQARLVCQNTKFKNLNIKISLE